MANRPLVSGAALGMEGQLIVHNYLKGPCYRCLFPTPPLQAACQRHSDAGVLGVVPGIVGTFQALEVGEPLSSRMLILDSLSSKIHKSNFVVRMQSVWLVEMAQRSTISLFQILIMRV